MPIEKALPLDGIPEAPHLSESVTAVRPDIQSQLSFPKDISAASNFFKPQGAESFLPSMSTPTGLEATAIAPPPGLEAGLGMPLTPGAEQMSPLINMIMKMPGGIGLASSFFEFLGSFFGGADMVGMLDSALGGDLLEGLMESAGESLSNLHLDLEGGGDSLGNLAGIGDGVDFDPVRGTNALSFNSSEPLEVGGRSLDGSFTTSPELNVSGEGSGFGKPLFEKTSGELNFAPGKSFGENDLLATDPGGGGFASTVGPAQSTSLTTQTPSHNLNMNSAAQGAGNTDYARNLGTDGASGQGEQPGDPTTVNGTSSDANNHASSADSTENAANQDGADVSAENVKYTVKAGDNLWDIAKDHLGDAAKWGELYKLNEGVIGQNPSLIMPGTELQLPGGDHLASAADYTVKSGDNLWDIAKDNLGGGEHWKELFHNNADIVGQNPDLIHPGQHLNLSGTEHSGTLASSHVGTAHGAPAAAHHSTSSLSHNSHNIHSASHGASAGHHVAHAAPAHHGPSHSEQAPAVEHTAQAPDAKTLPVELKAQAQSLSNVETYKNGFGS